jgi:hypothetical protein
MKTREVISVAKSGANLGSRMTDDHNNLFRILNWRQDLVPTPASWEKAEAATTGR